MAFPIGKSPPAQIGNCGVMPHRCQYVVERPPRGIVVVNLIGCHQGKMQLAGLVSVAIQLALVARTKMYGSGQIRSILEGGAVVLLSCDPKRSSRRVARPEVLRRAWMPPHALRR